MHRTLPSLSATLALASLAHAQAVPTGQDKLPPTQTNGMVAPLPPQGPLDQVAGQPNSQGTTFVTPGMPTMGLRVSSGQVTRFSNEFNPAFSFIIDALGQVADNDTGDDGADVELLSMELAANAWVDPNAWAYFVAVLEDEALAVEEAAIHYTGFGDKNRLGEEREKRLALGSIAQEQNIGRELGAKRRDTGGELLGGDDLLMEHPP